MKIITVATKSDGYFPALKYICKKNNNDLIVLGFGEKWKGWIWRTKMFMKFLSKCDPNEIIMIVDAYDVIVLASHTEIIQKYKDFDCDVLFSASGVNTGQPNHSWIYKNIIFNQNRNYFDIPEYKKYILNAGTFMGKVSSIYEIYKRIYKRYKKTLILDDQSNLNNINLSNLNYKIDIHSNIFWIWEMTSLRELIHYWLYNESYEKPYLYKKGKVHFNNITPCVVHGIGNRVLDKLCFENNVPYTIILKLTKKTIAQNDIKLSIVMVKFISIIILLVIIKYII